MVGFRAEVKATILNVFKAGRQAEFLLQGWLMLHNLPNQKFWSDWHEIFMYSMVPVVWLKNSIYVKPTGYSIIPEQLHP